MCEMCKKYEHMIAVTNRFLVEGDFLMQLEKVIRLHPHAVILREKDLEDEEYEALAKKAEKLCEEEGVLFFWHSRAGLARKNRGRNVHLSIPEFRKAVNRMGSGLWRDFQRISVSCHSPEDVKEAVNGGATQIILGTIFETDCKKGLKGKGVEFVRRICAECPIPVYAIGGINEERLIEVRKAGAAGGCMMSGFMKL